MAKRKSRRKTAARNAKGRLHIAKGSSANHSLRGKGSSANGLHLAKGSGANGSVRGKGSAAPDAAHGIFSLNLARAAIIGTGEKVAPGKYGKSLAPRIYATAQEQRDWLAREKIATYGRHQRKMWAWAVTGAILLFFILFAIEAGAWAGLIGSPSAKDEELLFWADMLAILVIAIDLGGRYGTTANKTLFFRENWLTIIAILPMGLVFRVGSALESVQLLGGIQAIAKAEEVALLAPLARMAKGAHVAAEGQKTLEPFFEMSSAAGKSAVGIWRATANFSVVTDFLDLAARAIGRIIRLQ